MPHISTKGRAPAAAAFLILLLVVVGLAACGGSSSNTTTTSTNAAATGASAATTPGTSSSGTSSSGTSSSGTSSSGTSPTGTPPAGQPDAGRYTAVRECLSKKGITLPQRTPGVAGLVGGGGIKAPSGMTHAQLAEALRSCNVKYAGGHFGHVSHGLNNPRFRKVLDSFAACLRQNGVDVGAPNTSGKGPIFDTKGINTGSPQFRAASVKCRSTLFSAARQAGRGFKPPGATG
jgi:hypothetical protein